MVLTKKLTVEDVDRMSTRYFNITDDLINKLNATDDIDLMRSHLFDAVIQGYDISFAFTYDWAIEQLVEKITKGRKEKKEIGFGEDGTVEPKEFKPLKKVKWGNYMRTPSIRYTSREEGLLKNLMGLGFDRSRIYDIYNKTYDKRTKQAVYRKVIRIDDEEILRAKQQQRSQELSQ